MRYAVESLLRSTIVDWELIVVGDACTDDTGDVVASFGDSRIQFYNMEKNCGEQSGPNNEGLRRARGEYVAFLSQDDLWFPDHLEKLLADSDTPLFSLESRRPLADLDMLGITLPFASCPSAAGSSA